MHYPGNQEMTFGKPANKKKICKASWELPVGTHSSPTFSWMMVAATVISITCAQILFKLAADYSSNHANLVAGWVFNPWVWTALVTNGLGVCSWMLALRRLPLSAAYPWTAVVYLLTPIASVLIFQETLSQKYVLGMIFIFFGVFLTTSSVKRAV